LIIVINNQPSLPDSSHDDGEQGYVGLINNVIGNLTGKFGQPFYNGNIISLQSLQLITEINSP